VGGIVKWSQPIARGFAHGLTFTTVSPDTARQVEKLLGVE
jgi:hypothetical protein